MKNNFTSFINFLFLLLFSSVTYNTITAQVIDIEFDTVMVHTGVTSDGVDLTGYVTFRMYAVCANENDIVMGMYPVTRINAVGGDYWQSSHGGPLASDLSAAELANYESANYDSWLTVNAEAGGAGDAQLVLNDGLGYDDWNVDFEEGQDIVMWSSWEYWTGWYSTTSTTVGVAGPGLRVLLGQLTTNGYIGASAIVISYPQGIITTQYHEDLICDVSDATLIIGCMDNNACNYNDLAVFSDCSCTYSGCLDVAACDYNSEAGCHDPSLCTYGTIGCLTDWACNYDPLAACEDYTLCIYPGCTNPTSCNYNPDAGCDNGTCITAGARGYVFQDPTPNITWDNNPAANGMANVELHLMPEDIWAITDVNGYYEFPGIPVGEHSIQVSLPDGEWMYLEDGFSIFNTPNCTLRNFGIVATDDSPFAVFIPQTEMLPIIHCTNGGNMGLWLHNTGTTNMSGSMQMSYNPILVPSYGINSLALPLDSIAHDTVYWTIPIMEPGEVVLLQAFMGGPGAEFIGDIFEYQFHLMLQDNMNVPFADTTWSHSQEVICAYDPNIKTAMPEGYQEQHFILAGQTMEYEIQFQNTGNYPAEDVEILDQIDTLNLDLSTLEIITYSHAMITQIESDGLVHFVFNNIYLPDSTSNEPASHGFVRFRIDVRDGVQPGTDIFNTGEIYFDENPAIITNTTQHRIFDCQWLQVTDTLVSLCDNALVYEPTWEFAPEEWTWSLNGVDMLNEGDSLTATLTQVNNEVIITSSNPLCEVASTLQVVNHDEEVTIQWDGDFNAQGPEGYTYQWFIWGQAYPEETGNVFNPWLYWADAAQVQAVVTNVWGCVDTTNYIFTGNVTGLMAQNITLYPNPASEEIQMAGVLSPGIIEMYNMEGQLVLIQAVSAQASTLQVSHLKPGLYYLQMHNESICIPIGTVMKE
ncbi:MAG: hypothetical protein RLZZ262_290 [Bacteroidota bacterium]|jgi:hypothetical protein